MQKKEIDDLNDTIKWFKTARRNNDMACILPDGPMMKNIIKWLEKLREYENRQEKGEKHDKSGLPCSGSVREHLRKSVAAGINSRKYLGKTIWRMNR